MNVSVAAIYEKGVLRPLKPLALPEHTQVEIHITVPSVANQGERQRARQALLAAGVIRSKTVTRPVIPVSEAELAEAAEALGAAGPLSEVIIAERDELS